MQLKKVFGLAMVGLGSAATVAAGANLVEVGQYTVATIAPIVTSVYAVGHGARLNLSVNS